MGRSERAKSVVNTSKTFDEELRVILWPITRESSDLDEAISDIKALIKKHQPEPRDPKKVGNESYYEGARGFRMGFTLGAASALADSDKAYGL